MKEEKIKKLFQSAKNEPAPEPPFNFSQSVVSAIQRETNRLPVSTIFDQLGQLFPRLAWAVALVIGLCLATELYMTGKDSGLSVSVEQVAGEWLFAAN